MIWVILRSGKVLQYNYAGSVTVNGGVISVNDSAGKTFSAKFPIDIVERIDAVRPCVTMKEKPIRKIRRVYK